MADWSGSGGLGSCGGVAWPGGGAQLPKHSSISRCICKVACRTGGGQYLCVNTTLCGSGNKKQ